MEQIDANKMAPKQVDDLSIQLGDSIRKICDDAIEKANSLLNIYGMSAKMQIVIDHPELKGPEKKKRGRPRKAPQS